MSAPYLTIAVIGTILMVGLALVMDSINSVQDMNIKDLTDGYNSLGDSAKGQALNSPSAPGENQNHDITVAGVTIPFIGDIVYFFYTIIMTLLTVLSTIIGFIVSITLLSTKFPGVLMPIIALGQAIVVISWYKVLTPTE